VRLFFNFFLQTRVKKNLGQINKKKHRSTKVPKKNKIMVHQFDWGGEIPNYVDDRDPLDHRLTWGKHRGLTLRELAATWNERHYLQYMLTRDLDAYDADSIRRALAATPEVYPTYKEAREFQMFFGKWKGETLGHIVDAHGGGLMYLRWVINHCTSCSPQLLQAIKKLVPG
jgi:hypothetical protein